MVCLCNIAKLAKETTTVRRVLEPLLNAFDSGDYWSPDKGVASSVLLFLQSRLEESGENCHVLVSSLIKHLDHKNVTKQQGVQVSMVNVATCLALHAKKQASGAMTAVIADLIKHSRKCRQNAAESDLLADESKQNSDLQGALEKCIAELSNKVSFVVLCGFDLTLFTSIANRRQLSHSGNLYNSNRFKLFKMVKIGLTQFKSI